MTVLVKIRDAGVKMTKYGIDAASSETDPMDKNTAHEILKRLQRLIDLIEEQNDILLYDVCTCERDEDGACECDRED